MLNLTLAHPTMINHMFNTNWTISEANIRSKGALLLQSEVDRRGMDGCTGEITQVLWCQVQPDETTHNSNVRFHCNLVDSTVWVSTWTPLGSLISMYTTALFIGSFKSALSTTKHIMSVSAIACKCVQERAYRGVCIFPNAHHYSSSLLRYRIKNVGEWYTKS